MEKRLCTKCNEFKEGKEFYENHKYWLAKKNRNEIENENRKS